MKKSQIIFSQYSPLMAVDTELVGSEQQTIDTPRVCSLCRCGESSYKPLCDGSHAQAGFDGKREDSNKKELEDYRGKEITIVFDRYLCMGAGSCGCWSVPAYPLPGRNASIKSKSPPCHQKKKACK